MHKHNMGGAIQTTICRKLTKALRQRRFANWDIDRGNRLEDNIDAFIDEVLPLADKYAAEPPKIPKLFSPASIYVLGKFSGKKTSQCFKGKLWGYRDSDFDNWLSADQRITDAGIVTVLTPMKDWTFSEAAISALNVSPEISSHELGKLLIARRHTMTLLQIEKMVEATERSVKTGLVTSGWGNFAFVETGNENDPVAVARVRRGVDLRPWDAGLYQLAYSYRWNAGSRLIVCNLDPSKLGF